ncbi:MAG: HAMP domain-containing sensor histidine kinase [Dermatophilus congolensis]|nr:HAMP domain-containing sensor histidine kinase [Dermatophilus congolensis]
MGYWVVVAVLSLVTGATAGALVWQRRRLQTAEGEISRLRDLALRRADQVSVLSHEIRTPLALVRGSAELLAEETPGPLTDVQRRFVDTIVSNADHVISMAEDLLAQARIEAGLFEVHLRHVELRSFLRSVVRDLRQVYSRDIVLDTPGPPTRVMLDPHLIRQLVGNLVGNSLRHDPDRTHHVTVRGHVAEGMVLISIHDSGLGMSEEQRAQLFERFRSTAALGEGTGIGLYISRHIAELHGGGIHVDTIAAHGTTMLVTFPRGGAQ